MRLQCAGGIAVAAAGVAILGAPAVAQGQPSTGRITGAAISAEGARVVGAEVRVIGYAGRGAVTADDGTFEIIIRGDTLPRLVIRRIGFMPETLAVRMPQAAALEVRLRRAFQMVRPVVVSASSPGANSILAEVRERERTAGSGSFLFRDEFMRYYPAMLTDVLRRAPGVQLVRTPGNPMTVRLRENRCTPLYWVDGIALTGIPFDPNTQPPNTVEAIEIYPSPSLVPVQFRGPLGAQACGSIVIWTRQGEYRVRKPKISTDSIVRLLDAQRVFIATEVDVPARVRAIPEPEYPDSLRNAGVGGSAIIEFIIEADGTINTESIGVVAATHIKFADAVRLAIVEATFTPAIKAERAVAQVYQLPVTFSAPPTRP